MYLGLVVASGGSRTLAADRAESLITYCENVSHETILVSGAELANQFRVHHKMIKTTTKQNTDDGGGLLMGEDRVAFVLVIEVVNSEYFPENALEGVEKSRRDVLDF